MLKGHAHATMQLRAHATGRAHAWKLLKVLPHRRELAKEVHVIIVVIIVVVIVLSCCRGGRLGCGGCMWQLSCQHVAVWREGRA
jgi:hypothetical protein